MPGSFEVTKLYAKIVPKLAVNFKADLQRQINVATKGSSATAKIGIEVNETSMARAKAIIEQRLSKVKAQVKLDIDSASITKANAALGTLKNKTIKIKVELVGYEIAKKKLASLGDNKTVRVNTKSGGVLPGGGSSSEVSGFTKSIDQLGRAFGRMSDVAGVAGVAVSGASKIIGTMISVVQDGAKEGSSFAQSLGGIASSAGQAVAVGGVTIAVLALVAALAAGTVAAGAFAIGAVILGAVVTALAVAATGLSAALAAAVGSLAGITAAIGVAALALYPVVQAFQQFTNTQNEAPAATNKATNAVNSQANAMRSAQQAIKSAARAVQDANHAAAESGYAVIQATRGLRDAGENLKDALGGQLRAREQLNEAEAKAKQNLIELSRAARDAAGEEEDAEIRLIRAQEKLASLNPAANDQTDYREAIRGVEAAERDLADQRQDNIKTQKDYDNAKKKGVKGDQDVIDAQKAKLEADRKVRDSLEAQKDAEHALANAKYAQARAIDAQKDAVNRLKDAELARNGVLNGTSGAYAGNTAAQRKLSKQFGQLTAQGQKFFGTIKEIYGFILKLSAIAQDAFLPGLGESLKSLMTLTSLAETAVKNIGTTMGDVAIQFGKVFASKEGAQSLTALADAANHAIGALGGAAAEVIRIVLPALAQLAQASKPVVEAFGTGFVSIASGLKNLFASLSNPQVTKALSALTIALSNVVANGLTQFGIFMEKIGKTMERLSPLINDALDSLVGGLFDALAVLVNSGIVEDFVAFVGDIGATLSDLAKNGFLRELGATMGAALQIIGTAIRQIMSDPKTLDAFIQLFQEMPPLIKELLAVLPILLPAFTQFIRASVEFTKAVGPEVLREIATSMYLLSGALDAVRIAVDKVKGAFTGAWNFIKNIDWAGIGGAIVSGFLTGIGGSWDQVVQRFKSIWEGLVSFVKGILGIASPSKVFYGIAVFLVQGFLNGIKAVWGFVTALFTSVFNRLKSFTTTVWTGIKVTIGNVVNSLKNTFQGLYNSASSVFGRIKNVFTSFKDNTILAFTKAKDGVAAVWNKLQNVAKAPVNFVIDPVYKNLKNIWDSVATKVGLGPLPVMRKFNRGGKIPGNSGMSFRDDRLASSPSGPIALAGGEFIMNAPATQKFLPQLKAMNAAGLPGGGAPNNPGGRAFGGEIPGFGIGGFIGGIVDKLKKGTRGALAKLTEPAVNGIKKLLPSINKQRANFDDLGYSAPIKMLDGFQNFIKGDDKKHPIGAGNWDGTIQPGVIGKMQDWALQQRGKVYQWATQGPNTFDCSGLVSNLYGIATGRGLNKRFFSTSDMPLNGWERGPGQFTMYLMNGHTAANVGGLDAEAYHGNGTPLAIGRIGTPRSRFTSTWHLPGLAAGGHVPTNRKDAEASWLARGWPEPYKLGGLVSGMGGKQSDKILAALSHGEFVMSGKATDAIGSSNLKRANDLANRGGSRSEIRGSMNLAKADLGQGGAGMVNNQRYFDVNVTVRDDHQVDMLANKLNGLI